MNRAFAIALVLVPSIASADITMMDHPMVGKTDNQVVMPPAQQPAPQPAQTTVVQPVVEQPQQDTDMEYDPMNTGVFTSGAVLFGGSYLASIITAGASDHPGAERLYVPVLGPWLALGDWGNCPVANPSCDNNTTDKVLLVADGIVQAAGILTMIDGLVWPSSHHRVAVVADKKIHVTPTGNGMAVFGHF
jgi:hypothetical protein